MGEKVKYFAAILGKFAGNLLLSLKNYIFLAASPLKSIKVSGAAGTKKKTFFFSLKKLSFTKNEAAYCKRII